MSTFYHLDSIWRNRTQYPNPANYTIPFSVTNNWKTINRTVQAVRSYCEKVPLNFVYNVALLNLVLPATFTTATYGNNPPFLYVEFRNANQYTDKGLINTTENTGSDPSLKDAVFVVTQDKIQAPDWIQYKSTMVQTYRIDPKDEMKFRVFDNTGQTIIIVDTVPPTPANPLAQTSALFSLTPYVREDTRESHFVNNYCTDY